MGARVGSTTLPMPRGGGPELNDYAQEVKVILETAFAEIGGAGTGLLAANNLSDLVSAATARTNLGIPHAVAQVVNFETGAVATGTTIIPFDDTIPQNTEGDQYMSLSITPTNASSTLLIDVVWNGSIASTASMMVALFQDSAANALAAISFFESTATALIPMMFRHKMTAGAVAATTFKVRAGPGGATTMTFNGQNGLRLLGGVAASSITITEILP